MKKLFSFVIFAALLIWTWKVVHRESNLGFETHAGIQAQLEQIIQAAVMAKRPSATDFKMQKLWTEPMASNKVKAHFSYSFQESDSLQSPVEQTIEGEAVLYREAPQASTSNDDGSITDRWILQSVKTTRDSVVFSEGTLLDSATTPATSPDGTATPQDGTAVPETTTDAPASEPSMQKTNE